MKSLTIVVLVWSIVIGGFFSLTGLSDRDLPTYTGKEVFNTEAEYLNFKEACASENVTIEKLDVLDSEPPIVVNFKLTTTDSFPYGEPNKVSAIAEIILGLGFLIGGVIYGLIQGIRDIRERRAYENI